MGRIFENCNEALNEIKRDIMEMGIVVHPATMQNKDVKDNDDYSTMEVQNYSFSILNTDDKDSIVGEDSKEWVKAEFAERVADPVHFVNPGTAWKLRQKVWEEFLVEGKMEYTYNDRINAHNQLNLIIEELKENPDSRQCIIEIHRPEDINRLRKARMPCSLSYQLMIRHGKLDIIYNMRSCDYDSHFKNDIWLADELRRYIAKKINIPIGQYHMNIGSLHRYKNYSTEHVF